MKKTQEPKCSLCREPDIEVWCLECEAYWCHICRMQFEDGDHLPQHVPATPTEI